jgi:AcrR family transcriptional regulator
VTRIGEPQNARSRRTRAALLDGARRLLEDEGSGALTMERVAAEAGVSRRSAYLHVASRGELLLALLEHTDATEGLAESLRPVAEAASVPARIDAWARHVASYHRRILPVVRAVDAARRADPDLQVVWDTAMQRWSGGCRAVAEEAEAAVRWPSRGTRAPQPTCCGRSWGSSCSRTSSSTAAGRSSCTPSGWRCWRAGRCCETAPPTDRPPR